MGLDFRGWTVFKTGPWGQGPVFLQQLALLDGSIWGRSSASSTCTRVIEGAKLAFADREAFYGDVDVPLERLLSRAYADERRALIGTDASLELRPGGGRLPSVRAGAGAAAGVGEPTRGDTCHLDVADRWGNLVSAPRPAAAGCRARRRCPGSASASARARRCSGSRTGCRRRWWAAGGRGRRSPPRWRAHEDGTVLAFGTPGGDQQDQWSFEFFLAHAVFGLDLQAAIDAPMFHTTHFPSSFYPRDGASRGGSRSRAARRRRRSPRCASAGTTSWSSTTGRWAA